MSAIFPPIIDGHNDTLLDIYRPRERAARDFFAASETGHIDLPRSQAGGLGGGFFAIFTPNQKPTATPQAEKKNAPPVDPAKGYRTPLPPQVNSQYALQFVVGMMDLLFQWEAQSQGQMKVVRTAQEMADCLAQGTLAAILHIEGAEAIDPEMKALRVFYQAGLRSIGIVWSRPNIFGHGVPFNFPAGPDIGPGLTDAGKTLVRACNELGILIDLSHLNEKGFWDVAELSDAPLVATHSGAHALAATPRNLTDKQLDAVARSGGMVGVNFHVGFLRKDGDFRAETSLALIADHVDYMVQRMGIDHVGLGSDFDGATMPQDMKDVAGLPKLMAELQSRGYDQDALTKIAHGNWLRVLQATWK
jgi:membrane dipeptidase